ncbi:MAG: hypothetical protein ACQETE_13080 [Bacteroidota bacterium]
MPDYPILDAYNWARLEAQSDLRSGEWMLSLDIDHTYLNRRDSAAIRIQQAYIDWYTTNADIRIGQQTLSWSRADLAIISDILSPIDLSRFLTRDFELVQRGLVAVNYTRYWNQNFFQLIGNPVFRANTLPEPQSRWFPNRLFPSTIPVEFNTDQSNPNLFDTQLAARYAWRSNLNFDLDVGIYWWHQPNPAYRKDINLRQIGPIGLELTESYPQSWMGFLSTSITALDPFVLNAELLYTHQRALDILPPGIQPNDLQTVTPALLTQFGTYFQQNDDDLLQHKPTLNWMGGIQYSVSDWTLSAQFIQERILNYNNQIIQSQAFNYTTLLVQKSFFRDKLQLWFQGRHHFLHQDFWLHPKLTYQIMDNVDAEFGAHIFGGGETPPVYGHISFYDYRSNSLGYLRFNWYF